MSSFSSKSLKAIFDCPAFEIYEINAGSLQGSLFSRTLFLIYINDPPKKILGPLVNICAYNTIVHGCTSKNKDDQ